MRVVYHCKLNLFLIILKHLIIFVTYLPIRFLHLEILSLKLKKHYVLSLCYDNARESLSKWLYYKEFNSSEMLIRLSDVVHTIFLWFSSRFDFYNSHSHTQIYTTLFQNPIKFWSTRVYHQVEVKIVENNFNHLWLWKHLYFLL